jgi:RHS repeat-associated protein
VIGYEGSYAYDGYGRRVQQTNSGGTIDSFYDSSGALIYQQDRSGDRHDYLYLQGHLVAIRDYNASGIATLMRYQDTDAQGSIIRQTDSSGNQYPYAGAGPVYDAWGRQIGGLAQDGPGYTGHVMDQSTSLIYMQQRYYDPSVGRFLSMDPVDASNADGSNLDRYWYANDNPYRYTDPDGRDSCSTGTHLSGQSCASLGVKVMQVSEPSAPTSKIAHQMVSNNPADRVSAAHSAMDYFGINPDKATKSLDIKYDANFRDYGKTQLVNNQPGVGEVTLGPRAYITWSHLGSTLGHEIEVHWNRQFLPFGNYQGSHDYDVREAAAYKYNLENAQRFGNTAAEVQEFQDMYNRYDYAAKHAPDEIYTQ